MKCTDQRLGLWVVASDTGLGPELWRHGPVRNQNCGAGDHFGMWVVELLPATGSHLWGGRLGGIRTEGLNVEFRPGFISKLRLGQVRASHVHVMEMFRHFPNKYPTWTHPRLGTKR